MNVAVTGAGGFIGSHLARHLEGNGHTVVRLVRRAPASHGEAAWDPDDGWIDRHALEGIDHVVHLAGSNIGARRWTAARKRSIRDSRVRGTESIARALAQLSSKPRTLVSASALGYYGDRGDEVLTEESPAGSGFRAEVCRAWEEATAPARGAGIRVVLLRSGIVLSRVGGLLPYLLMPAKLGIVPRLGSGRQYWSWIALDDVLAAIVHLLSASNVEGAVNLTSPAPARQAEFARAIAATPRRVVAPIPKFLLDLVLGTERAHEVLLSSTRAVPETLLVSGYEFRHASIDDALRSIIEPGR